MRRGLAACNVCGRGVTVLCGLQHVGLISCFSSLPPDYQLVLGRSLVPVMLCALRGAARAAPEQRPTSEEIVPAIHAWAATSANTSIAMLCASSAAGMPQ
jgi:hypothetical protein